MAEFEDFVLHNEGLSVAQEQADQAAIQDRIAAVGGRNARSLHTIRTTGEGRVRSPIKVDFAVTFVEKPHFTTGFEMVSGFPDFEDLPQGSVGVAQWIKDRRGFYVGAHCFASISIVSSGLREVRRTGGYVLLHHLCFEALAMRDVSYDALLSDR